MNQHFAKKLLILEALSLQILYSLEIPLVPEISRVLDFFESSREKVLNHRWLARIGKSSE